MYPILVLVVALLLVAVRGCLNTREQQEKLHEKWRLPWVLIVQPFFLFNSLLITYCMWEAYAFIDLATSYKNLDTASFDRPYTNTTAQATALKDYVLPAWLADLSIAAPFFIVVTLVITTWHIWLHIPPADTLRWYPTYSHDLAMQVVNLPLVYGIFALDNITTMLTVFTGSGYSGSLPGNADKQEQYDYWEKSAHVFEQAYETNYELADLYEARALHCFGLLCFALVQRQVLKEAPTVKHVIDTVETHFKRVDGNNPDVQLLDDLVLLKNPAKLLYAPLQQTSNLGVQVFVWTYALKSMYSLLLTGLAEAPFNIQLCGTEGRFPAACSLSPYVEGAAMLASTLAIMNIFVFEHNLSEFLNNRKSFRPVMKFFAVKVLVSIVFFQYYILAFLGSLVGMSTPQTKLCYSCLICLEVLPLSVLVLYSWSPTEGDWHSEDRYCRSGGGAGADFAGANVGEYMEGGSFTESRMPTASVSTRVSHIHEMAAYVELRGLVTEEDGRCIEHVIHALSRDEESLKRGQNKPRISATFKNAAVCGRELMTRARQPTFALSASGSAGSNLSSLQAPFVSSFAGGLVLPSLSERSSSSALLRSSPSMPSSSSLR